MPVTCGIDMVEVGRIKKALERRGSKLLHKMFTQNEIDYCRTRKLNMWLSFATRFAAKESVAKALGTGFSQGVSPSCIEIILCDNGKPEVKLSGLTYELFKSLGGKNISISLSHTSEHAVAMAVIEFD